MAAQVPCSWRLWAAYPLSAPSPRARSVRARASGSREVTLLDYGAGNVRSVRNAIARLGYEVKDVTCAQDVARASKLIFPGVGAIGQAASSIKRMGVEQALKDYLQADRPFLGICLGMQLLFEGCDEDGGCQGLGIIPGRVTRLQPRENRPVPHIGWNQLLARKESHFLDAVDGRRVYFVHSYAATPLAENADWTLAACDYGGEFLAAVQRGNVCATQFHPEKSGAAGLDLVLAFLRGSWAPSEPRAAGAGPSAASPAAAGAARGLARRVIACLDVRADDAGRVVVTKGEQYDVRESRGDNAVRDLGEPVDMAGRYFAEGADEVAFLNITGFRDLPLGDLPMLRVLRQASEQVFVPLTVGGGIRGCTDGAGRSFSALEVAAEYFRSGADKVSIGGDAVVAAEEYKARGNRPAGDTAIEAISKHYGAQAVVVSIDPRRVYVRRPEDTTHAVVKTARPGPDGEEYCWWQCTIKGGREGRDVDAVELAEIVQALGAGEIMLNCIDNDGEGKGFDLELVDAVASAVSIPVVASSGAGAPAHFSEVFEKTGAAAALAAGIFHRREVSIADVKKHMAESGLPVRQD